VSKPGEARGGKKSHAAGRPFQTEIGWHCQENRGGCDKRLGVVGKGGQGTRGERHVMVEVCEGTIKACKNGVWLLIGPGEAFSDQCKLTSSRPRSCFE